MSVGVTSTRAGGVHLTGWHARKRLQKDERRRLARQDVLGVRLVELHHIRALLEETTILINIGWIQNAWCAVLDAQGRQHKLTVPDFHLETERPVILGTFRASLCRSK